MNQHEEAAQVLNTSYLSPSASTKIIQESNNGVTSLNDHQHDSHYSPKKRLDLKVEDNTIVTNDSYTVGMVDNIKESNR